MHGFINVNKSLNWTSNDVVRFLKGRLRVRKVGHGGTLDPLATGVLPIAIGSATRFITQSLMGTKEYRMTIELGRATDTYDNEGRTTTEADYAHVTRDLALIEQALTTMRGEITQTPPKYSALKVGGERAYKLARRGVEFELKPRQVEVKKAEIAQIDLPIIVLDVTCGNGWYARSYAHELGQKLGTAAYLKALLRTRVGKFAVEQAFTTDELAKLHAAGDIARALLPLDYQIQDTAKIVVDNDKVKADILNGVQLAPDALPTADAAAHDTLRVYDPADQLIAMLGYDTDKHVWRTNMAFKTDVSC